MPDLGDLLTWLMAQIDRKQESANQWAIKAARAVGHRDEAMEELASSDGEAASHLQMKWAKDHESWKAQDSAKARTDG